MIQVTKVEFICWRGDEMHMHVEYWPVKEGPKGAVDRWIGPQKQYCKGNHSVKKYKTEVDINAYINR